jgi:hypothetical protein
MKFNALIVKLDGSITSASRYNDIITTYYCITTYHFLDSFDVVI